MKAIYRFGVVLGILASSLLVVTRMATATVLPSPPALLQVSGPTCDELQVALIVDQSGSMFGFFSDRDNSFVEATDPAGLRFLAAEFAAETLSGLRYGAYTSSTIQMSMVYFAGNTITQMDWQPITPNTPDESKQILQGLEQFFVPLPTALEGSTRIFPAFEAVSLLFDDLGAQNGNCPVRIVIAVTDGQPTDENIPAFNAETYLQDLADYVRQYMPPDTYSVHVIGLDARNSHWDRLRQSWEDVAGSSDRATKVETDAQMAAQINKIILEATDGLVPTAGVLKLCVSDPTLIIPPYVQQARIVLVKDDVSQHLELQDSFGNVLEGSSGLPSNVQVNGYNERIETMDISNPEPGRWQLLTQLPASSLAQCQVSLISITAKPEMKQPAPGMSGIQYQNFPFEFQIVDNQGNPLPDYSDPDYQLQMTVELMAAGGNDQLLALGADPGQVFSQTVPLLYAGRNSLGVTATSRLPGGGSVEIFNQPITSFDVEPVRLRFLDGPSNSVPNAQYVEMPWRLAITVVGGTAPITLDLPTSVAITVTHESGDSLLLSPLNEAGEYEVAFTPEKSGQYSVTYEAAVIIPDGSRVTLNRDSSSFSAFPVTRISTELVSEDTVVATNPFWQPIGIDAIIQMVDEAGNPVTPSQVGSADPLAVFVMKIEDQDGNDVTGNIRLISAAQPGSFRLTANDLGPGEYVVNISENSELNQDYLWSQPSWAYTIRGTRDPQFYAYLAMGILLATAMVLAGYRTVEIRRHPLSGYIQIYEEKVDALSETPTTRILFRRNLSKRNRVTWSRLGGQGCLTQIKRIKMKCESESASKARTAVVEIKYKGRPASSYTLVPGNARSIGGGCFIVKDPSASTVSGEGAGLEPLL